MKNNLLFTSVLGLAILFLVPACGEKDDTTPPTIILTSPTSTLETFGDIQVAFEVVENDELDNYEIKVVDLNSGVEIYNESNQTQGKELSVNKVINVEFPQTDSYELIVSVTDQSNNIASEKVIIRGKLAANLALNFKLKYDGEPFVVFDDYLYPEFDFSFFLTRVSMYIANVNPVGSAFTGEAENIGLIRLEESHFDEASASEGYTYTIPMSPGNFESIEFGLGVPSNWNAMRPNNFSIENPLSKSGEYWDSWNSYIFTKIEGKADVNGNPDDFEEVLMALHMGGDEAYRAITINQNGTLTEGETTTIEVLIDLKDIFLQNGEVYDLTDPDNTQLHSVLQMDQVIDLSDRFANVLNN